MASPESVRNSQVFPLISVIVPAEPTIITIIMDMISTTIVRTAVATVESVLRIPHFASIAVIPAKNAEPAANKSHICNSSFLAAAVDIFQPPYVILYLKV